LIAGGDGFQGGSDGGGATVKIEVGKILGTMEARVEEVAAELEILLDFGEPSLLFAGEQAAEGFGAGERGGGIFDAHALAVVGEDHEEVGPRAGASAGPARVEKAKRK
jgi:hypothetical protein